MEREKFLLDSNNFNASIPRDYMRDEEERYLADDLDNDFVSPYEDGPSYDGFRSSSSSGLSNGEMLR